MKMISQPDHIVVVVEENHSYSQIIGNPSAPYINALAAQGTLFTDSHAITHPSEPNYFALFSGSTQGVTDDGTYQFSVPTLAGGLQTAGLSFLGYAEAGSPQDHNPWQSFADSQATGRDFSQFPTDFSKLPTVAFVSPNELDDMHDGTIAQGDQWLRDHLGAYADWAQTHNSLLVVTFDENAGDGTNHIATLVTGAGVAASQNDQYVDHYSLLRAIEDTYGLPALGESAHASVMNLTDSATTTLGNGPDALVLKISEDAYQGDAQYTISIDGKKVDGTLTAHASHAAGQDDIIAVQGSWGAGSHTATVNFLNDAWSGTAATDRNLYVDGITIDGQAVTNGSAALMSAGPHDFSWHL